MACVGGASAHATLTDAAGKIPLGHLIDGTEVAILAWRPDWAGNTRYRVRATASGLEGWLPVGNLRNTEIAAPSDRSAPVPPAVAPAAAVTGDSRRRFGQSRG